MSRSTFLRLLAGAALAALVLPRFAHAATFEVGPSSDNACGFDNIQDAIDATNGTDSYLIRVVGNYTAQHLVINGKHLTLEGGYADCSDTTPGGSSTLDGSGHTGDSVIEVSGFAAVTLSHLTLENGAIHSDNGAGGGLNFDGHGSVTLHDLVVSHNYSAYGAGINVDAVGGSAELHVGANTSVLLNTAQYSGGGIRVHGGAVLYMVDDMTWVFGNEAIGMTTDATPVPKDGYGGGVEVVAPSRAYIGSPGFGASGVISDNRARYGGGLSLTGAGANFDAPWVALFTTDATRPVRISGNFASVSGGGIQLEPNNGSSTHSMPRLCARDFRIDGNSAPDGSAIYSDTESYAGDNLGGVLFLNVYNTDYCLTPPAGTVTCTAAIAGTTCDVIDGNLSEDANGDPTDGDTVVVMDQGNPFSPAPPSFVGYQFAMRGNVARHAMRLHSNYGHADALWSCLFADNDVSGEVFATEGDTPVTISGCTFAGNSIQAQQTLAVSDDVSIAASIIWQSGKSALAHVDGNGPASATDVLANETASLGTLTRVRSLDPLFVDPVIADYRLQAASPGVDAAPSVVGPALDGSARGVDLPLKDNYAGVYDLGAYELHSIGNLVIDPGFADDLHAWISIWGTATWDGSTDAAGDAGSGSVHVVIPSGQTAANGIAQCVHLPGLTDYTLTGYARAFSTLTGNQQNHASIRWELRANSSACTGAATISGVLALPSSNPIAWRQALAPAIIPAHQLGAFGPNTTLLLTLAVSNSAPTASGGGAWFDGISVTPGVVDEIFADGFEETPHARGS